MKYFIKDIEGKEHGPVDQETLAKWVDEDRVTADTPVRNQLIVDWKTAKDVPFLKERLSEQATRQEVVQNHVGRSVGVLKSLKNNVFQKEEARTTFMHQHEPQNASAPQRIYAFLFDLLLISVTLVPLIFGLGLYVAYDGAGKTTDRSVSSVREADIKIVKKPIIVESATDEVVAAENVKTGNAKKDVKDAKADKSGKDTKEVLPPAPVKERFKAADNMDAVTAPYTKADHAAGYGLGSVWYNNMHRETYLCLSGAVDNARWMSQAELARIFSWCAVILIFGIIIYYGCTLGYFAQTFGMWFWGIFITKSRIKEVYFFRAFAFTVLMLLVGIISPLFIYIFGRGLHDFLTGVRIIRVAGRTKV
ncbi:MAG: RDD family protein [Victivallaceae bacterium]